MADKFWQRQIEQQTKHLEVLKHNYECLCLMKDDGSKYLNYCKEQWSDRIKYEEEMLKLFAEEMKLLDI